MNQHGGSMKACNDDQRIGGYLVKLRDRMGERAITLPGGRKFKDSEQRQSVAARKLRDNAGNRNC